MRENSAPLHFLPMISHLVLMLEIITLSTFSVKELLFLYYVLPPSKCLIQNGALLVDRAPLITTYLDENTHRCV